jgi:hypothetical protein
MIFGKLKLYLLMALGFVAALGVAVLKGMSLQKLKRVKKDHKDYVDTRENIEDSQSDAAKSDPSNWLRKRKSDRDL